MPCRVRKGTFLDALIEAAGESHDHGLQRSPADRRRAIESLAAESATNAREGGALVPIVAFGIPTSAGMAVLLGAFLIHGLVPGPDMLGKNLDVTYSMVWSIAIANILGSGLCFLFSGQFAKLATLRHDGVLKRIRTTPLPAGAYLSGVLGSTAATTLAITACTAVIGWLAFGAAPRAAGLAEIAGGLALGVVCFG